MDSFLFAGTTRTRQMIGRQKELEQIRQAISRADQKSHIVLITGPGGLGKTRLIEEVASLRERLVTQNTKNTLVFSQLIEMADFRIHTRIQFLNSVRNALIGTRQVQFPNYDDAYSKYQSILNQQTGRAEEAARRAEQAFLDDYKIVSSEHRIVWLIDTGERLAISGAKWLLDNDLLKPKDLTFTTQRWLEQQIRQNTLPNTTIILASRDEEGKMFLELIRQAAKDSDTDINELHLKPFTQKEVHEFFKMLAQDWNREKERLGKNSQAWQIAEYMDHLSKDQDRINVLHLYTNGQPVRLSLYTNLIVEGIRIPSRLEQSYEEARQSVDITNKEVYEDAQQEIEQEFITLLFRKPNIYAAILTILVRAERELNIDQLGFTFYSTPDSNPSGWAIEKNQLVELENSIQNMRQLSIIKSSPNGNITLQDEIYRIYSRSMLQNNRNRQDELLARQTLYRKLLSWTNNQLAILEKKRTAFQHDDENKFRIETPARALQADSPLLSDLEIHERQQIRQRISELEIERMYYEMLIDPLLGFNNAYCKLVDQQWLANNEEGMAVAQAEAWRILNNHEAIKFAEMRLPRADNSEQARQILLRAAQQESVVYWLKLFTMRREYERVVELNDEVDKIIDQMIDIEELRSWKHNFPKLERACWREYARIMQGNQISDAIRKIEPNINNLVRLANSDTSIVVFDGENGFIGHPALIRLRRTIALIYNVIGYGYVTLGSFRQAIERYGQALRYIRDTNFRAQEATILNNLSRALSEIGRVERARQLCLYGLELRRQEGAESPIASSINTLALIDNNSSRPDLSWSEAATAFAYFKRFQDERGRGLALIQLGMALRRLANQESNRRQFIDPIDRIYDQAEYALKDAFAIFSNNKETPRLVEVNNELGCLFRDRMKHPQTILINKQKDYYRDAKYYLRKAIDLSKEGDLKRLQIDSIVDLAWTHYYSLSKNHITEEGIDLVYETIEDAENLIPEDIAKFTDITNISPMQDDSYIFYHLSNTNLLRAIISMDKLSKTKNTEHNKEQEPEELKQGAEYFVKALGYAQLFSPRSIALSSIYNKLYDYIKDLNSQYIRSFYLKQKEYREKYNMNQIQLQDLGNLDDFMQECFGLSKRANDADNPTF